MALSIWQYMLISLFSSSGLFFGFLLGLLSGEEIKHRYFDFFATLKKYLFLLYALFSVFFYMTSKTEYFVPVATFIFMIGLPIGTVVCREKESIKKYVLSGALFLVFTYLFFNLV